MRWPDHARKVGDSVPDRPHETDGSNPSWLRCSAVGFSQESRAFSRREATHPVQRAFLFKRAESGDRHSLSDGCCSRGGRARYGCSTTGGATSTGATRRTRPRYAPGEPGLRFAVFPTLGTNVGKRVTRSSRRGSRRVGEVCRPRFRHHANFNRPAASLPHCATRLLDLNRGN